MLTFKLQAYCTANGITISDVAREARQTLPLVRRYWYDETKSYNREAVADIMAYLGQRGATVSDLFVVTDNGDQ